MLRSSVIGKVKRGDKVRTDELAKDEGLLRLGSFIGYSMKSKRCLNVFRLLYDATYLERKEDRKKGNFILNES